MPSPKRVKSADPAGSMICVSQCTFTPLTCDYPYHTRDTQTPLSPPAPPPVHASTPPHCPLSTHFHPPLCLVWKSWLAFIAGFLFHSYLTLTAFIYLSIFSVNLKCIDKKWVWGSLTYPFNVKYPTCLSNFLKQSNFFYFVSRTS